MLVEGTSWAVSWNLEIIKRNYSGVEMLSNKLEGLNQHGKQFYSFVIKIEMKSAVNT